MSENTISPDIECCECDSCTAIMGEHSLDVLEVFFVFLGRVPRSTSSAYYQKLRFLRIQRSGMRQTHCTRQLCGGGAHPHRP